jgi:hypothetical protein
MNGLLLPDDLRRQQPHLGGGCPNWCITVLPVCVLAEPSAAQDEIYMDKTKQILSNKTTGLSAYQEW